MVHVFTTVYYNALAFSNTALTFHLGVCVDICLYHPYRAYTLNCLMSLAMLAARVRAGSLLNWLGVEIWWLCVEQREHILGLVSSAKDNVRWLPLENFLVDIVRFAVVSVF